MSRNFGIMSGRSALGGTSDRPSATRDAIQPHDSNQLARHLPPGLAERNLAIVRDGSFIPERKLHPIEPLDPRIDHREFAALVIFSVLLSVTFGLPLAIAVAFMSFG